MRYRRAGEEGRSTASVMVLCMTSPSVQAQEYCNFGQSRLRDGNMQGRNGGSGMTTMYKLYGRAGSGSFAVQAALEELGAPYERIWVGRDAADVARFQPINPTGRVP